jgi:hypothetical protein
MILLLFLAAHAWIAPLSWMKCFGSKSVTVLATSIRVLCLFQAAAAVMWVWSSRSGGVCFQSQQVPFTSWVLGVMLITLGLSLIRQAHSEGGSGSLYYAERLRSGRSRSDSVFESKELASVQKVTQTTKAHYVGTVLLVWGVIIGLWNQLPENSWFVGAFWSMMFAITSVLEDYV